jgi:hypothetical protein
MTNCGKNTNCGCSSPLTTPGPCGQNTIACPRPEKCSTFTDMDCVIYSGDPIIITNDEGTYYIAETGNRFTEIMQNMIAFMAGQLCPTSEVCFAPLGLKTTLVAPTYINLQWDDSLYALSLG